MFGVRPRHFEQQVQVQAFVSYRASIGSLVARAKIEDLKECIQLKDYFLSNLGASVSSERTDSMIQIKDTCSLPLLSLSNSVGLGSSVAACRCAPTSLPCRVAYCVHPRQLLLVPSAQEQLVTGEGGVVVEYFPRHQMLESALSSRRPSPPPLGGLGGFLGECDC